MPSTADGASAAQTWAIAIVVAASVLVAFVRPGEVVVDDAFITFRYAENLAAGRGLVFNPGERVEGYSNLLYTLLLAATRIAGIPTVLAAQVAGGLAGAATLACLPGIARSLGASAWRGVGAAAALGATACFSGWMFRGLEAPIFTLLLALGCLWSAMDRGAGRSPSVRTLAAFGLLGITRPEGPTYLAAIAMLFLASRRVRDAGRFLAGTSLWVVQVAFRVLYYGDPLPNTYYAKVWPGLERWRAGLAYAMDFAVGSGPVFSGALLACACVALARRRGYPAALAGLVAACGIFFAIGSGGEGMPDGRFFHPALPFVMALAFVVLDGRRGDVVAALLLMLALGSHAAASSRKAVASLDRAWIAERVALLTRVQDRAQTRVGAWLRDNLPPGSLVAVNDCGVIPYVSGLPVLDTAGLMDRHIARLPGRKHGKVDLRYVLERRPAAIVLALRNLAGGLPYDMRMASEPAFLAAYRLAAVVPYASDTAYYVFRDSGAPMSLPRRAVDLLALLPEATCVVSAGEGAVPAGDRIEPGYHWYLLHGGTEESTRIQGAAPKPGDAIDAPAIARLDAALHELGSAAHHGIAVRLPEGSARATITFTLRRGTSAGRLALRFGMAPWLWQEKRTHASATLSINATDPGSWVKAATVAIDPVAKVGDRLFVPVAFDLAAGRHTEIRFTVERGGPPGSEREPLEVLIEAPRIETGP